MNDVPIILVCGGRNYADYFCLRNTLDKLIIDRGWVWDEEYLTPKVFIISGGAKGARDMVRRAKKAGIEVIEVS